MSVYVDKLRDCTGWLKPALRRKFGPMWCHMVADSLEELHDFARNIRLPRNAFHKDATVPHYDLVPKKRLLALQNGAEEREQLWSITNIRNNEKEDIHVSTDSHPLAHSQAATESHSPLSAG